MKVAEVIIVALLFIAIGAVGGWRFGLRSADVRRKDYKHARIVRNLAIESLNKIEDLVRKDHDLSIVETPLAGDIRRELNEFAEKRREAE